MHNNNQQSGFTLLELMVVIAIAGILGALAIPSYQTMIKNNCLTTTTNNLVSHLQLARSEAVKRQRNVMISSKSGSWNNGWEIRDAAVSPSIIRDMTPTSCAKTTITTSLSTPAGGVTSFTYRPNGFINSSGTFIICDDREPDKYDGRQIEINAVGRPNTSKLRCT